MIIEFETLLNDCHRSSKVMMKQVLPDGQPSTLDLDNLAGSTEISLKVSSKENADQRVQLGVELQLPAIGDNNPTRTVHLAPRYIVVNKSNDVICVCQDGFQVRHFMKFNCKQP